MTRARFSTVVLTSVSLLTLAACGGEEPSTTAAPTPSTTTSATADTPSATGSSAAAADPASDKKLCEAAKKIGDESKAAVVKAVSSGQDPTPLMKKAYTDMAEGMVATAATGGSGSEVATALAAFGTEAGKVAGAADMTAAADGAGLRKASADANAACKQVGVNVNF
ncbi:hypothetical protein [Micromonospora sp. KC723]|uniref:hypothetical protein n=1 Tax=Micromonospora sp. KC723 TaxID=2530381 RepID=UPI0010524624|nr:hypothetical protein [Micromonospora sp. KC723]TDB77028.1 hypothetical protein E1165_04765 [Micromonospora sp. KC723]